MVLVSLVDAGEETEAVSVSDGSSKLNLIWSKTSYARGHPYTVIDPGTKHAAAAAALCRLTQPGYRFICRAASEVLPAVQLWSLGLK